MFPTDARLRLRPIELLPDGDADGIAFRDPAGHSPHVLKVPRPVAYVLSRLDGRHDLGDIQAGFMRRFGRLLYSDELDELLRVLDEALYLDTPRFQAVVHEARRCYREAPLRPMIAGEQLADQPAETLQALLQTDEEPAGHHASTAPREGRLRAFVAPHLDYPRGRPCYAAAYRRLANATDAERFVILGTNHFGSCGSVVGTRKDFATPFGPVLHDGDFMDRLDRGLETDLCEHEFDHAREHSIELQVHLLRHALNGRPIRIVPYLCPDPCGPSGTRPRDGRGADLRTFAQTLGDLIASDATPTCIIASADLSHVGEFFQDDTPLDDYHLFALGQSDRRVLNYLVDGDPEGFRSVVAEAGNPSNICSIGCLFATAIAMRGRATARLRRYHQAVTREAANCVSCCAIDYVS